MNIERPKLSPRLDCAARMAIESVRADEHNGTQSVADIGTDHALLPIFLALSGFERALASDIREGPCAAARANVARYGVSERVSVVCRPGIEGIERFAPDCIMICGMGGEMIASILEASSYPESSRCRLILQPQSMQDVLRYSLTSRGFRIDEERVVLDEGKFYQLISARYDGGEYTLEPTEAKLGRLNLERAERLAEDVDLAWLEFVRRSAMNRLAGMKNAKGAVDTTADETLIARIDAILMKTKLPKGIQNADNS